MNIETYSIGFTQKKAEHFFSLLRENKVRILLDVRLNNVSQLAGFAKRDDLIYFLREICEIDYMHIQDLTPTADILNRYKTGGIRWDEYADLFLNLMSKRNIERSITPEMIDSGCLLCSEHQPHNCHRSLVLNYLKEAWRMPFSVKHLL